MGDKITNDFLLSSWLSVFSKMSKISKMSLMALNSFDFVRYYVWTYHISPWVQIPWIPVSKSDLS